MKRMFSLEFVATIAFALACGGASAQTSYQWSYAFDQHPATYPGDPWGTGHNLINDTDWVVHSTADDMAYVQGYHGVRSGEDQIGMGATLGQPGAPSRVTLINRAGAPALGLGDSLSLQFAWRPTGSVFDTEATGNSQNQIIQFGLLGNPFLPAANSPGHHRNGTEGGVGTFGGAGYSFLGDATTDAFYFGATQVGNAENTFLTQGGTNFVSGLTVNFGVYNEQGTQLINFGTHTLGIETDHEVR